MRPIDHSDVVRLLTAIIKEMSAEEVLEIKGVYEVVVEELNNDILDAYNQEQQKHVADMIDSLETLDDKVLELRRMAEFYLEDDFTEVKLEFEAATKALRDLADALGNVGMGLTIIREEGGEHDDETGPAGTVRQDKGGE